MYKKCTPLKDKQIGVLALHVNNVEPESTSDIDLMFPDNDEKETEQITKAKESINYSTFESNDNSRRNFQPQKTNQLKGESFALDYEQELFPWLFANQNQPQFVQEINKHPNAQPLREKK